jgi:hypothetical protein
LQQQPLHEPQQLAHDDPQVQVAQVHALQQQSAGLAGATCAVPVNRATATGAAAIAILERNSMGRLLVRRAGAR